MLGIPNKPCFMHNTQHKSMWYNQNNILLKKMDGQNFLLIHEQISCFYFASYIILISNPKSLHKIAQSKSIDCPTRIFIHLLHTNERILLENDCSTKKGKTSTICHIDGQVMSTENRRQSSCKYSTSKELKTSEVCGMNCE